MRSSLLATIASFILASSSSNTVNATSCAPLDGRCYSNFGKQGECCPGYLCQGDQWWAQCKPDPAADNGTCTKVWQQCQKSGDCCLGNYCDVSQSWRQCKPGQEPAGATTTNAPTKSPTKAPTKSPTKQPTSSPVSSNGGSSGSTTTSTADGCGLEPNLGAFFSESTGPNAFQGDYPSLGSPNGGLPKGRDDSVAFYAGGNYIGKNGAEIEGKIVVRGNFRNFGNGVNSMVQAGYGSQIIPNNGQDIIQVGGQFRTDRDVAVMQNSNQIFGDIVYGKNGNNGNGKIWTNGEIRKDLNLDLSIYDNAIEALKVKSKYWATLNGNGKFTPYDQGPNGNTMLFEAGDGSCVQVFNLDTSVFSDARFPPQVKWDWNMRDKTTIINVKARSDGTAEAKNLANFIDSWNKNNHSFSSKQIASILWNFYDATTVKIHGDSTGEFIGTILAPFASLEFGAPGQSGRTIVGGDITQDKGGSEFHSFEFDPVCNLPLPPCGGPSPTTTAPTAAPTSAPTAAPTSAPTKRPTSAPTKRPTSAPTKRPTSAPTAAPTPSPTAVPTNMPTNKPSASPTNAPTPFPTPGPTAQPTAPPTPSPTVAPTGAPTKAPTVKPSTAPTRSPTKNPTPGPTAEPTPNPTPGPTAAPTKAPTAKPSKAPTAAPIRTTSCPADIVLSSQHGITDYVELPIGIISQDKTSVTFEVVNTWTDTSITAIYTNYAPVGSLDYQCLAQEDVTREDRTVYTAQCMKGQPITVVDVYVTDDSFVDGQDDAEIPRCCHPPDGVTTPTVHYKFVIYCVPQCPAESARSLLRGGY